MSKHTPGPWALDGGNHIVSMAALSGSVRVAVIDTPDIHAAVDWPEAHANARLVSAAPDLLEALTALVGLARMRAAPLGDYVSALAVADAAIAKATGE